jgi:hypothetical protein
VFGVFGPILGKLSGHGPIILESGIYSYYYMNYYVDFSCILSRVSVVSAPLALTV